MSTLAILQHDAPMSRCNDEIAKREYVSVTEAAIELDKSPSRVYRMAREGLLEDVGIIVVRTKGKKKGRIWIGIIRSGLSHLSSMEQKGDP